MNSMAPECTELKKAYDTCFHAWYGPRCSLVVAVYDDGDDEDIFHNVRVHRYHSSLLPTRSSRYAKKYLNGNYDDSECKPLFKPYQDCLKACDFIVC